MQKIELRFWIIGIAMLIALFVIGAFTHAETQFNILDHQAAGTARKVDEIQQDWRDGGVFAASLVSMFGDLLFIGAYTWGAIRAGMSMRASSSWPLSALGLITIAAGVIFCVADYSETIAQIAQMFRGTGSDTLAALAATMQPIKSATFLLTIATVIVGLVVARFSSSNA